jgi:hypothetical protein
MHDFTKVEFCGLVLLEVHLILKMAVGSVENLFLDKECDLS